MSNPVEKAYRRLERRLEHRIAAFRRWVEHTQNLLHLTILVVIPLLMGVVTALSNTVDALPYLLFPPLASGTYTLFSDPEGEKASPRRFVGGLSVGALCGWFALAFVTRYWQHIPPGQYTVNAGAVAFGLFLTGVVTWTLDLQEPSAYSTALLVHVTGTTQLGYVLSVTLSSLLVASVFLVWREGFYEKRAALLYESIRGDDHVLVPMTGDRADATAMLGARLAAAHDAGKVVLLDVVDDEAVARAERELLDAQSSVTGESRMSGVDREAIREAGAFDEAELDDVATGQAVSTVANRLEAAADRIETKVGVPTDVAVAVDGDSAAATILQAAHEANCDLIAIPYAERYGGLSPTIRQLFGGDVDVIVHRSRDGRTRWKRVMVPVRRAGGVAHSMIDFATRLAGQTGHVSVCHCVDHQSRRRKAEEMLADLVETATGRLETRVAAADLQEFLAENAPAYDLVIIGASQDRSGASRFVSPPTFERLADVETDVAIVDRNFEQG
ncbi:HPP family protein [Halorhabdus amylolytica]|uniref:HPP family protein n=1 Tax=Halorhabdus amylolytica TaxID=2559573 RepID=UPI0010AA8E86|nr:HPP family protein [Halorhabdus amylolytica]